MSKLYKAEYASPLGVLEIVGTVEAIISILFSESNLEVEDSLNQTPKVVEECMKQLDEYFNGTRLDFTFPYAYEGTDFQKTVWNALTSIPYGVTASYKSIADHIGNTKAVRAVGSANGKNKLSIIIPCHRIIGSNGTLTGYAGELWRKEWLLEHEKLVRKSKS
ncbi:methylated-DNA--[protein]-cysteine S-methyltransferase [Bacillus sp. DJP31]|uniref:methylated-DNA--[protein]-cysteine S-methyltransferase n=1 Tax=Bacillus sp. DJP31 TaxID=3409789 RepID=UPI003BB60AB7